MKLATGETFPGFAESKPGRIRKIGREQSQHAETLREPIAAQQQPANGQQPQAATPARNRHNDPAVNENQSLTDWFLDETAKRFGYQNGAEMVADQNARYQREQQNNALLEQYKNQHTVSEFSCSTPNIPNTDHANDALEQIINRNGWDMDTGHDGSGACASSADIACISRSHKKKSQSQTAMHPRRIGPHPRQ